ncbi:hypothetical protein AB0L59_30265 [Streptomyces sp. NPDC052109]|uniref:hypothetical protein n=1 Tax=Streptomyces sp. NPDC052109 TaxID=3155527 RepID=UPI00344AFFE2
MDFHIDQWAIDVAPWGWLRLRESSGEGPTVYLHYESAGQEGQERLDLQAVVMRSGENEALSGRVWRRIPFSEVERFLTFSLLSPQAGLPESMQRSFQQARTVFFGGTPEAAPPSLDTLEDFFDATAELTPIHMSPQSSGMLVTDEGRLPEIKPPQGRISDEFLQDVADAYRKLTDMSKPPAPAIAELSGAPVRTVHRWIYEARKRGILPPARPGRAG